MKYLSSHHCPLQQDTAGKESKMDCPNCGNLVKQKYLKIHQKNHCVGIRTSTFTNFRTATTVININTLNNACRQISVRAAIRKNVTKSGKRIMWTNLNLGKKIDI